MGEDGKSREVSSSEKGERGQRERGDTEESVCFHDQARFVCGSSCPVGFFT
jgi:hypothetical protein